MEFLFVLIFTTIVLIIDFFPYSKESGKKETALYLTLMAIGVCIASLYTLGVKVPSPAEPIKNLIEAVFGPQT